MASIAEQIELLPQLVSDTRTTNYLTLAAFVVFLYDMILTLPEELEFVWKARWTTGKVLFILNRYPVFLVSVFLLVYMFDYYSAFKCLRLDKQNCVVSNYVEAWSMLVFIIPVQVILILRTLALWEQNRRILVLLIAALVASDSTIIVSVSLITKSLSFENRPAAKQILGCYGSLNELSTSTAIPSWIALMIFDTTVFVLTLVRVEGIRRAKKDRSLLLHILFRDGIVFYIIMLASSIANLALYSGLPFRRRGLIISLIPLLRTVMSVCTARLLLNLRSAAVDHGRSGQHWALGELELSTASFSRSAFSSSSTARNSCVALRVPQDFSTASPTASSSASGSGSERGRILVSISKQAEEYRDNGDASLPSSFRVSMLNKFTNIANTNIELGELRPNIRGAH